MAIGPVQLVVLGFEHPLSGDALEFRSELPGDLLRLRHSLGAT